MVKPTIVEGGIRHGVNREAGRHVFNIKSDWNHLDAVVHVGIRVISYNLRIIR